MQRLLGTLIVGIVVLLNLAAAILLSLAAKEYEVMSVYFIIVIGVVLFINLVRMLLWYWIHKTMDLSRSYALTALFYPLIAIAAIWQGETVTPVQWAGVALICLGVAWITLFTTDTEDQDSGNHDSGNHDSGNQEVKSS